MFLKGDSFVIEPGVPYLINHDNTITKLGKYSRQILILHASEVRKRMVMSGNDVSPA